MADQASNSAKRNVSEIYEDASVYVNEDVNKDVSDELIEELEHESELDDWSDWDDYPDSDDACMYSRDSSGRWRCH